MTAPDKRDDGGKRLAYGYAIVSKNKLVAVSAELPIYWSKRVARERNRDLLLGDGSVVRVEIYQVLP